jgi:hypothetical protein
MAITRRINELEIHEWLFWVFIAIRVMKGDKMSDIKEISEAPSGAIFYSLNEHEEEGTCFIDARDVHNFIRGYQAGWDEEWRINSIQKAYDEGKKYGKKCWVIAKKAYEDDLERLEHEIG